MALFRHKHADLNPFWKDLLHSQMVTNFLAALVAKLDSASLVMEGQQDHTDAKIERYDRDAAIFDCRSQSMTTS